MRLNAVVAAALGAALGFVFPPEAAAQHDATPIPALLVEISQTRCPADGVPAAIEVLRAAAAHHDLDAAMSSRLEVEARSERRRVTIEKVAQGMESIETATMRRGSVPMGRELWLGRFEKGIFAVPMQISSLDGRHEAWEYPPFHADLAYYFLTEEFWEAHELTFLDHSRRVIGYCAKDRDETYIDGRIVLHEDGRIATIDWLFSTPGPREEAGGRAVFGSPLPLPRRGVFWRRLPSGDYSEWVDEYLGWSASER